MECCKVDDYSAECKEMSDFIRRLSWNFKLILKRLKRHNEGIKDTAHVLKIFYLLHYFEPIYIQDSEQFLSSGDEYHEEGWVASFSKVGGGVGWGWKSTQQPPGYATVLYPNNL